MACALNATSEELGVSELRWTESSSARYPLGAGRQYLLFAKQGQLVICNCGNSRQEASALLQFRAHGMQQDQTRGSGSDSAPR